MKSLLSYIQEAKSNNCEQVRDEALKVIKNSSTQWNGNVDPEEKDVINLIKLAKEKLKRINKPDKCYVVIGTDSKRDVDSIIFIDLSKRYNSGHGVSKHGVSFHTSRYSANYSLDFMKEKDNSNSVYGKMDKYEFYEFDSSLVQSLWDALENKEKDK